ncbi:MULTISPECIES: family 15 carbohydrate-binding domain-containing protein [unclassified Marinimicrobium]|jgi:hypothetical protein|uniref:family 15 carbohydrate-binding domain-containing protein n=1 Tax=unclassified Marinimicrobium TaxID=2632100 RepID=UPI002579C883|nr:MULTISPECIES: family 15 carbohydrate-binding domain-containing protein [unclassified Marinimicrobium]
MLQKFMIALCAVFALSACGGDDQDDQSRIVLNPPEDLNAGEDEESEEEEEPEEEPPVEPWVSVTFDAETDIDSWEAVCVSAECNATTTLAYNADAQAMDVTPDWLTAGDEIEVSTPIDPEIADLSGGFAHLNLFVPVSHSGMIAQVFFQDASDRKGYIGYTTTTAGWNTFYLESIALDDFGFANEGFDLTAINRMGVQIQSAEGFLELNDTLHIDDAIISSEAITVEEKPVMPVTLEPLATGDESFTFDSDVQGWTNDGSAGSAVSHDADAGALVITPDWDNADEGGNRPKAMGITTNVISNATVRMIVTLTEAQVEGGIGVQPYIQQNADPFNQVFGSITTTGLVAGDNLITYEAGELENAMRIGVQLVGPITGGEADVALIKQVEIDLPEGNGEETNSGITVDMTSGWRASGDLTVSYSEAGVSYQPEAASDQMVFDPAGPADYAGADIVFTYEVDQAFIDSGANLQPFFQLKDYASWDYHFCWIGNGDLALGEQTFTCTIPATLENDNAPTIPDGQTAQVGVQTNGGGAGTVTISSVTINLAE